MSALPINATDTKDDLLGAGSTAADQWNLYGPAQPFPIKIFLLGGAGNGLANSGGFCLRRCQQRIHESQDASASRSGRSCGPISAGATPAQNAAYDANLPAACQAGALAAGTSTASGVTKCWRPGWLQQLFAWPGHARLLCSRWLGSGSSGPGNVRHDVSGPASR